MNAKTILILVGLVAAGLFAWGLASMSGGTAARSTESDADVLARVNGEDITRAEVEQAAGSQLVRLRQQIHDITERSLYRAIDSKLLDVAAADRGLDRDAFLAMVIDSNPPVIPASRVDSVYEEVRDQVDQPREVIDPQIEAYLLDQARRARADSLIAGLRDEYEVVNLLEPQRIEVATTGPAKGAENAPVTIVEFSDFECPYCLRIYPTLNRIMEDYEGRVRLVFRQFPLNNIHPRAQKAAEASLCAHEQGMFWEMHDAMFENSSALDVNSLKLRAAELGMDSSEFDTCLDTGRFADQVATDLDAGQAAGISGTPALFINGRFLSGAQPYEVITRVIDDELRRGGA